MRVLFAIRFGCWGHGRAFAAVGFSNFGFLACRSASRFFSCSRLLVCCSAAFASRWVFRAVSAAGKVCSPTCEGLAQRFRKGQ